MSILQTGLLRKHYEEALEGIEHKPSAFWQVVLQRAFWGKRRILGDDRVLARQNPSACGYGGETVRPKPTTAYLLCSGSNASARVAACTRSRVRRSTQPSVILKKDNLMWIWAMTTLGTSFRMWFINARIRKLQPVHGNDVTGDRTQYIDADSPAASVFPDAVQSIKDGFPLPGHASFPANPLDLLTMDDDAPKIVAAGDSLPGQDESHYDHDRTEAGPSGDGGDEGLAAVAVGVETIVLRSESREYATLFLPTNMLFRRC